MLAIKHLFRDISARMIVYAGYPVLFAVTVLALTFNSWIFFAIMSISFFFSMDAVLVQSKHRFLDISNFYASPKSFIGLCSKYLGYRLRLSFILCYLPSLLIGAILLYAEPIKSAIASDTAGLLMYVVSTTLSWLSYIIISTPLLIVAIRSTAGIEVFRAPGYLFYIGFLLIQLVKIELPIPFTLVLPLYGAILLLILGIGYYLLFGLIRQQKIFP